jgi:tetratricopeptide (TPR) repeat protein
MFTFFFSYSRGGYIALVVCLAVYFALANTRLSSLLSLVLAAAPVGLALFHVRGLKTVFSPTTDDALRTAQGHVLGHWALLAIVVVILAQVATALAHRRVHVPCAVARFVGAFTVVAIVVGMGAGAFVYTGSRGGMAHWVKTRYEAIIHDSDTRQAGGTPGRLLSLNSGRLSLWHEALKEFPNHPWTGTGAGTFRFTHYLYRSGPGVVKHAHNQWLNVLSELGLIGLALFVVAIGAFVAAALRRLWGDRDDVDRSLLAALQAAALVFVIHMSWDWDWDMAAATLVFLLFAGTAASYIAARRRALDLPKAPLQEPGAHRDYGWALRALASGFLLLVLASWTFPYLSQRAYSEALVASGNGHPTTAAADARRAHRLDPLAVDPLITLALVEQQLGEGQVAMTTLDQAARLQPQNYEVYYQRGLLYMNVLGDYSAAAQQLRTALRLNPHDLLTLSELQLLTHR